MTRDAGDPEDEYVFNYSHDEVDQPTIGIVKAVAWVTGIDPTDLEPLHAAIDVDSLEAVVRPTGMDFYRERSSGSDAAVEVRFIYEGCDVTVTAETIHVLRRAEG